ncbi:MAG: 3-ketoacyl-ACP reductase [Anaerolineaceae bacterium]|nr:3-ketoacyl-ACP reductase [Anaerolineaceae bacterium]
MADKTKKVALITGSGRGIGRGIAIQLAEAGWTIVINDFSNPEPPKETLNMVRAAGSNGMIIMANITIVAERDRIVEETLNKYGRVDLLVNNAGIGPRVRMDMLEISEESMLEVLNVNLIALYFLTQQVAKVMIRLVKECVVENPKIVNISSMSAYTSSTSRAEYCISKAGVSMCTLLFADRLADEGINVYEIRPGIIKTPMTEVVTDKYDKLITEGVTPIKRWGQPEDIAKSILAIAEGYFPFSTGQAIEVDGGFHIRRL